jgi:DNA-binding NtrC family response regulator
MMQVNAADAPTLGAEIETEPPRVLVVDDEPLMRSFLTEALTRQGYQVTEADSGHAALAQLASARPQLALLDIRLGDMDGLELLEQIRERLPECVCVMMTAHGTVEIAVRAMKRGATDFLMKPFTIETLEVVLEKVLGITRLRRENRALRAALRRRAQPPEMIGASEPMTRLIELVRTLAHPRVTVLVMGESGTGKELVAQALHTWGPRAAAPFVKVNCAALPAGLMESELFGHERGAFTGASALQRGKFELADGGTILLDEVSEMDVALQPKLLRCLQEKEFYRVGGARPVAVDARIVATTNADLDQRVRAGAFRADLLYRLKVVPVRVPPLRERREDIPLLVRHFLDRAALENGREIRGIDRAALDVLLHHDWPGNVRELENVIARASVICQEPLIRREHLLWEETIGAAEPAGTSADPARITALPAAIAARAAGAPPLALAPDASLHELERAWILRTLEEERGNRTRTARRLGVSVRTIRNKLREYETARAA